MIKKAAQAVLDEMTNICALTEDLRSYLKALAADDLESAVSAAHDFAVSAGQEELDAFRYCKLPIYMNALPTIDERTVAERTQYIASKLTAVQDRFLLETQKERARITEEVDAIAVCRKIGWFVEEVIKYPDKHTGIYKFRLPTSHGSYAVDYSAYIDTNNETFSDAVMRIAAEYVAQDDRDRERGVYDDMDEFTRTASGRVRRAMEGTLAAMQSVTCTGLDGMLENWKSLEAEQ